MKTHKMRLKVEPFHKIKKGLKTIELRLYDEKRREIHVDDEIIFENLETKETIHTKVLALYVFDTFKELYEHLSLKECGYKDEEVENASYTHMEKYYPLEKQKQYKVVGIKIELYK